jgi:hypothetical protein
MTSPRSSPLRASLRPKYWCAARSDALLPPLEKNFFATFALTSVSLVLGTFTPLSSLCFQVQAETQRRVNFWLAGEMNL